MPKMKTRSAAKKRFQVKKCGKVKHAKAYAKHLFTSRKTANNEAPQPRHRPPSRHGREEGHQGDVPLRGELAHVAPWSKHARQEGFQGAPSPQSDSQAGQGLPGPAEELLQAREPGRGARAGLRQPRPRPRRSGTSARCGSSASTPPPASRACRYSGSSPGWRRRRWRWTARCWPTWPSRIRGFCGRREHREGGLSIGPASAARGFESSGEPTRAASRGGPFFRLREVRGRCRSDWRSLAQQSARRGDLRARRKRPAVEALRVRYLGKKGELSAVLGGMGKLAPEERAPAGGGRQPGEGGGGGAARRRRMKRSARRPRWRRSCRAPSWT